MCVRAALNKDSSVKVVSNPTLHFADPEDLSRVFQLAHLSALYYLAAPDGGREET
jgi:hypothetical protein